MRSILGSWVSLGTAKNLELVTSCLLRSSSTISLSSLQSSSSPGPSSPHSTSFRTPHGLGNTLKVPLLSLAGHRVGTYELAGDVFDVPIRIDILHRVVRWQLAKKQQGTHKTKTRGDVSGGGRKPYPQKKTGNARRGTTRAPHHIGGGVAHGPVPRSHAHDLPKRIRRMGLRCALSAKAYEGRLIVVESLRPEEVKTKYIDNVLATLLEGAPRRSVLCIDRSKTCIEDGGMALRQCISNLPWVDALPAEGANVYSILQKDFVIMSKHAADAIVARLRSPLKPF